MKKKWKNSNNMRKTKKIKFKLIINEICKTKKSVPIINS